MSNEADWKQFRETTAYKIALRGSLLYLPLLGHLSAWLGLASRLDRWTFFSLDAQLWIGMASGPLLILPALLVAGLLNVLDRALPRGCQIYAAMLPICVLAMIGGGLFVGPLLDF